MNKLANISSTQNNMEELRSETRVPSTKTPKIMHNNPSLVCTGYDRAAEVAIYASDRPTFSSIGVCDSSASNGWDSCFAAACNTRLWTSDDDDGEIGSPLPLVSTFPAAHETACAPSFTGESNKLHRSIIVRKQRRKTQTKMSS